MQAQAVDLEGGGGKDLGAVLGRCLGGECAEQLDLGKTPSRSDGAWFVTRDSKEHELKIVSLLAVKTVKIEVALEQTTDMLYYYCVILFECH